MHLFQKPFGVETRWASFENPTATRGSGGIANKGAKGHPYEPIEPGETKTLLDVTGSGTITRIWMTVSDRSPELLRSMRLDMFWDGAESPAVSVPLGDFFGFGLAEAVAFESQLLTSPQGRSFNSFMPMPFRHSARVTITNESTVRQPHLFYEIDLLMGVRHEPDALYFHAHWRRESPNVLGSDFTILPGVFGAGRFLGCHIGVACNSRYRGTWWGEGEVKVWFGDDVNPTLCGTGAEDYIGTGWGQGPFLHRTQGCTIADETRNRWAFYRFHIDDPIFFEDFCRVSIQTIGGAPTDRVAALQRSGVPLIPTSIADDREGMSRFIGLLESTTPVDLAHSSLPVSPDTYCNFWRQDDWTATAYFYLDHYENNLPTLSSLAKRIAHISPPINFSSDG